MWCDNCLLLFPLRWGAVIWAAIITIYSIAGGIFLFKYGQFIYFVYPEWLVYGGIAMIVAFTALVNLLSLANHSYIGIRVSKFLWPFAFVLSAVRAILMIMELTRGQSKIQYECDNGGALYGAVASSYVDGVIPTFPTGVCRFGVGGLYTAIVIGVCVDLGFQAYMVFMNWRYAKRLEKYQGMIGPVRGGYYES